MTFKVLTFLSLLTPSAFAADTAQIGNAKYVFEDRAFASLFERTLILGHTLSADFMVGTISKSVGPGTVLAETYAGRPLLANLAEPRALSAWQAKKQAEDGSSESYQAPTKAECAKSEPNRSITKQQQCDIIAKENTWAGALRRFRSALRWEILLEPGLDKIARLVYQVDDEEEKSPIRKLKYLNRVYKDSTAIVGLDALYLSATESMNACEYMDIRGVLEQFVTMAFADGKVLILGNVPLEDYGNFSQPFRLAIYPQVEPCRQRINDALRESCTTDRNCYLVDMEKIVADLKRDRYLTMKSGLKISGVQTRPDGVNLSNRGTQFIVEKILSQLRASPPREAKPSFDARPH